MSARLSRLLALLAAACLAGTLAAEQKYNPHSGQRETASPKPSLQYNPYGSEWLYVAPGSRLEYNPHAGEWEYPK